MWQHPYKLRFWDAREEIFYLYKPMYKGYPESKFYFYIMLLRSQWCACMLSLLICCQGIGVILKHFCCVYCKCGVKLYKSMVCHYTGKNQDTTHMKFGLWSISFNLRSIKLTTKFVTFMENMQWVIQCYEDGYNLLMKDAKMLTMMNGVFNRLWWMTILCVQRLERTDGSPQCHPSCLQELHVHFFMKLCVRNWTVTISLQLNGIKRCTIVFLQWIMLFKNHYSIWTIIRKT